MKNCFVVYLILIVYMYDPNNIHVYLIDPFHIVISLSNCSSIGKLIKSFLKMKGQIAY